MSSERRPAKRKPHDLRERELLLAVAKIKRDQGEKSVTFASVARAVGVSTALIHNCFPKVSSAIATASGRTRERRSADQNAKVVAAQGNIALLRAENRKLREQIRRLASINENLLAELRRSHGSAKKVSRIK